MEVAKNIRDSIHGDIPFTRIECELMDTAYMQRLRGIRQLGTSCLVFPGAVHTRFEHSLGTNYIAKKIMASLERQHRLPCDTRMKDAIAIAALLHDVTHVPFGHTLEDERRIFPRHDQDESRLAFYIIESEIGNILKKSGLLEEVLGLLDERTQKSGENFYASQIISHTICADLLDYLRRDARHCGLKLDYDDRIYRYFDIEDGKLILQLQKNGLFRHDAFSEIIHLLRIRYFLTERVYYHHAKIAAGAMVSRAVERAVRRGFKKEHLYTLSDDALIYVLRTKFGSDRAISRLVQRYESRKLYKRCYVVTDVSLTAQERVELSATFHLNAQGHRERAEKLIARKVRIPHEAVIIYAPPATMNLKEADVLVKVDDRKAQSLNAWRNTEIRSLQEKFGKLWKLYVFVDPEYDTRFPMISRVCEEIIGFPNDLPMIHKGQLSLFPTAQKIRKEL